MTLGDFLDKHWDGISDFFGVLLFLVVVWFLFLRGAE